MLVQAFTTPSLTMKRRGMGDSVLPTMHRAKQDEWMKKEKIKGSAHLK